MIRSREKEITPNENDAVLEKDSDFAHGLLDARAGGLDGNLRLGSGQQVGEIVADLETDALIEPDGQAHVRGGGAGSAAIDAGKGQAPFLLKQPDDTRAHRSGSKHHHLQDIRHQRSRSASSRCASCAVAQASMDENVS